MPGTVVHDLDLMHLLDSLSCDGLILVHDGDLHILHGNLGGYLDDHLSISQTDETLVWLGW